jgi:hypothetical protein
LYLNKKYIKINEAQLNQNKKQKKSKERIQSYYTRRNPIKLMKSKSPKNNTSYFAIKKRDEKIKKKKQRKNTKLLY